MNTIIRTQATFAASGGDDTIKMEVHESSGTHIITLTPAELADLLARGAAFLTADEHVPAADRERIAADVWRVLTA